MKYRVLESKGVFTIEVLETITKTSGILWWKKTSTIEKWVRANEYGYPLYYARFCSPAPMEQFTTLESAFERIKTLTLPSKIHYPNA